MIFSERLKELRADKQCTQKQLAKFLGLTPNSICEWENNRSEPNIETIIKISAYFEVSVDYLLGLEDDFGARTAAPMGSTAPKETTSEQERELLSLFRELSPYLKGLTLDTVRSWAGKPGATGLHKKA